MENKKNDPQPLNDKENIRKNIRESLVNKRRAPAYGNNVSDYKENPIDDLFVEFITNFRKSGGKYIPCTTDDLVKKLVKIGQSQKYNILLNTSPNLAKYLQKYGVRYVSAINTREPVDAALFFSNVLVARTGSIGFTQSVSQYASAKNLSKNIIVVSRGRCIFQELEDALNYQKSMNNGEDVPLMEFITPVLPEVINGTPQYSPKNPQIILMLVEEPIKANSVPAPDQHTEAETQPSMPKETCVESQQQDEPQPTDHEEVAATQEPEVQPTEQDEPSTTVIETPEAEPSSLKQNTLQERQFSIPFEPEYSHNPLTNHDNKI